MMAASWYFDFISPYAYLQLPRILALRERLAIEPVPIVFGAVLQHHGQLGPAEIPGKREFTYRLVHWQAEEQGVTLRFPPTHPFNSLAALRLCLAAGNGWNAVTAIFRHIWHDGQPADTAAALGPVAKELGIADAAAALASDSVKLGLRTHTEQALAAGIYGVPSVMLDNGECFWGNDATSMLLAYLDDPSRFERGEYARIGSLPVGVKRSR
jgi:2-hydroxychromene-2-carboxylate isomerase